MKKTILIVSIIIVCGLAIFGIVKLTSNSEAISTASDKTAAKISAEASTAANTAESSGAASTADTKDTKAASGDTEASKDNTDGKEPAKGDVIITIGSGNASAEQTVVIPVSMDTVPKAGIGSCNFNIKYDTKVLEVVEVLPGDITKNIEANLEYSVIETTGMVSYLFTSSNDGKDAITKPGVLTKIKFKVKKDAEKGATAITNGTAGAFGDNSLNKISATFNSGELTVK
ncbi:cohesin domain-containing protein [Ruminiclostridium sufflavum DSM 19573]|uniref:Cohesin domain-containing protein n=1 Tax=Ruminiclostridium sufflavum DSM 19573 TaxID=1121337 RepID=A0A318XH84_9FIRM|nr:cohesin domain-containing protein [Ruminiclostridium sufflavum]PYG86540.1 cohesin domain-containing protein [Ruminiclostridium sufflavum DSM 19573]